MPGWASQTFVVSACNFVRASFDCQAKATRSPDARFGTGPVRIDRVCQAVDSPYGQPHGERQQTNDRRKEHQGFSESQNEIHIRQEKHATSVRRRNADLARCLLKNTSGGNPSGGRIACRESRLWESSAPRTAANERPVAAGHRPTACLAARQSCRARVRGWTGRPSGRNAECGLSTAIIPRVSWHLAPSRTHSTIAMHSISIFSPKLNCAPHTVSAGGASGKNFRKTPWTF